MDRPHRMPRGLAALLAVLAAAAPGCALIDDGARRPIANPYPAIRSVAVLPFADRTHSGIDGVQAGDAVASVLVNCSGLERVVRPEEVASRLQGQSIPYPPTSPEEASALAALLQVDAVVAGALTEHDPYFPPRLGMALELIASPAARQAARRQAAGPAPDGNLESLVRGGQPFRITAENADMFQGYVEHVYDAQFWATRAGVEAYAGARVTDDRGFTDGQGVLRRQDEYLRFVGWDMIRTLFARERERQMKLRSERDAALRAASPGRTGS